VASGALYTDQGSLLSTSDHIVARANTNITTNNTSAAVSGSTVKVHITGNGEQSFYARTYSGLGLGNYWNTYTAELTATQPYTITLQDTVVTVNSTHTYTGSSSLLPIA
jgi:archaellum component FlaF (FlaF/FlaG flagellin family)